jgi:hypothetical protein
VLVFVGRFFPGKPGGVLAAELLDHGDGRLDRPERHAVEDVQLAAAAGLPCVFLERRLEEQRPEVHAGQPACVHRLGKQIAVDPRRADDLERSRGPAPFREDRAFEQNRPGIDNCRVERRDVRRRHDPGQARIVEVLLARPAVHPRDLERRPDDVVEHERQLSDRHAVAHRNWKLPDKGRVRRIEQRPFERDPADRIRAVADHHFDAMLHRGAQAVGHRVHKRVDAGPHVLQVHHEDIEPGEHLSRRLARFAVQGVDRQAPAGVLRVRALDHVVLQVGAEPVLRPEDRGERDVRIQGKPLGGVP